MSGFMEGNIYVLDMILTSLRSFFMENVGMSNVTCHKFRESGHEYRSRLVELQIQAISYCKIVKAREQRHPTYLPSRLSRSGKVSPDCKL